MHDIHKIHAEIKRNFYEDSIGSFAKILKRN